MVTRGVGDSGGWGMDGVVESPDSKVWSLYDSSRSGDGAGNGVALGVNHMGWYRLRERVANIRWSMCCCVFVCRTIVYERDCV